MRKNGFTLIELLIVIAIIAILALIAIPNFLEAQTRAKVARVQSDLRSLATALEAFQTDNKKYPYSITGATWTSSTNSWFTFHFPDWAVCCAKLTTPVAYITSVLPDVFQEKQKNRPRAFDGSNVFDKNLYAVWRNNYNDNLCYAYEISMMELANCRDNYGLTTQEKDPNWLNWKMSEWKLANGPAAWMVASAGPDRDVFSGYRTYYSDAPPYNASAPPPTPLPLPTGCTPASPDGDATFLTPWPYGCYDPTNGSISYGSIRRTNSPKHSN